MRPVFIAASPNTQSDDVREALRQLVTPWRWYDPEPVAAFEKQVSDFF
ncbi:MAG: hypothetical protein TR69_WS6001001004 [candidate division WS6 bacterium OLB20]|uniref:Uncharacterized protein n=1 Tax=candidate division WS6 bacterium OLB20 TaxID=1617426 RepID=A0A136LZ96_9BACT|nr:MAG: hypothetical protein TR69_WS6001001004 [candidate division WS6 bacterium OLB20]